jgi:hypothetical protein
MIKIALVVIAGFALVSTITMHAGESATPPEARTPVLVELFTSEGCSSCPPADRYLQKLDQQPRPGAEMIVLSEHVDYWNHIGWKDPFSARFFSDRQSAYAKRFGLGSVYTPQMVVDGTAEFVGSDSGKADRAFQEAARTPKIPIHLSAVSLESSHGLRAHLEVGPLADSFNLKDAEVYVAIAMNHAASQVSAGENAGHQLTHVAVVKSLVKVADLRSGQGLSQDVALKVEPSYDVHNLRLIAFLQEPHQGRILGAARLSVNSN